MRIHTSEGDFEFSERMPARFFGRHESTPEYRHWERVRSGVYLIYYQETLEYVGTSDGSQYGIAGSLWQQHFSTALIQRWIDHYTVALIDTDNGNSQPNVARPKGPLDLGTLLRRELKPSLNS
jgi:hypothetical protein